MLAGEVDSSFWPLSDRKQCCHLTGFELSERSTIELIFVPDLTRPPYQFIVETAKQIAHLAKHIALPITLAHHAQIKSAQTAGVRCKNSRSAFLSHRRRVGVLNGQIAQ